MLCKSLEDSATQSNLQAGGLASWERPEASMGQLRAEMEEALRKPGERRCKWAFIDTTHIHIELHVYNYIMYIEFIEYETYYSYR